MVKSFKSISMKLKSLVTASLLFLMSNAYSQGVINGNFETWNNKVIFEDPV